MSGKRLNLSKAFAAELSPTSVFFFLVGREETPIKIPEPRSVKQLHFSGAGQIQPLIQLLLDLDLFNDLIPPT